MSSPSQAASPPDAAADPSNAPEGIADLDAIVRRLRPKMKRTLQAFGVPPHDAEDILQEVFLAVLSKWDTIDNKEAWMVGALRNRCAAYWRCRHDSVVEGVDMGVLEALSEPQPAPQERAALVWDLEAVFEMLPARQRSLLWLRFGLGLSPVEVAERLGYCPTSIRKLTCRSLERLRVAVRQSNAAG